MLYYRNYPKNHFFTVISEIVAQRTDRRALVQAMWAATLNLAAGVKLTGKKHHKAFIYPKIDEIESAQAHLITANEVGQVSPRILHLSDAAWYALLRTTQLSGAKNPEEIVVALLARNQKHNELIDFDSLTKLYETAYQSTIKKKTPLKWVYRNAVKLAKSFNEQFKRINETPIAQKLRRFSFLFMPEFYYFTEHSLKNKKMYHQRERILLTGDERQRKKILEIIKREAIYDQYIKQVQEIHKDGDIEFRDAGKFVLDRETVREYKRANAGSGSADEE